MNKLIKSIFIIAAIPFIGTLMHGQPSEASGAQSILPVRFVYVSSGDLPDGQPEPDLQALLDSGTGINELLLGPGGQSPVIEFRRGLPLTLFKTVKKGEREERKTLASLSFPPAWKGALFLVRYNRALSPYPYQFTPIEFWGGDIADKHVRFYNLCPVKLAVVLAGTQASINPHQSADLDVSSATTFMPIKIFATRSEDGRPVAVKTGLPKLSAPRLLLLAYPMTAEFNNISILTVGDLPMPPTPSAVPAPR